jgi:hypothetical protein
VGAGGEGEEVDRVEEDDDEEGMELNIFKGPFLFNLVVVNFRSSMTPAP